MLHDDEKECLCLRDHVIWNGLKINNNLVKSGHEDLGDMVATTRVQFGLDENAIVLSSFNTHAKHTFETFELWCKVC